MASFLQTLRQELYNISLLSQVCTYPTNFFFLYLIVLKISERSTNYQEVLISLLFLAVSPTQLCETVHTLT